MVLNALNVGALQMNRKGEAEAPAAAFFCYMLEQLLLQPFQQPCPLLSDIPVRLVQYSTQFCAAIPPEDFIIEKLLVMSMNTRKPGTAIFISLRQRERSRRSTIL